LESEDYAYIDKCNSCTAVNDVEDPVATCARCKTTLVLEKYNDVFLEYVSTLMEIRDLRNSGFDIKQLGLSLEDWKTLVIIDRFYEIKKISLSGLGG